MNMTSTFRNPLYTNVSNSIHVVISGLHKVGIPKKIVKPC